MISKNEKIIVNDCSSCQYNDYEIKPLLSKKDFLKAYEICDDPWLLGKEIFPEMDKIKMDILSQYFKGNVFQNFISLGSGDVVINFKDVKIKNQTYLDISQKVLQNIGDNFKKIVADIEDMKACEDLEKYDFVFMDSVMYYLDMNKSIFNVSSIIQQGGFFVCGYESLVRNGARLIIQENHMPEDLIRACKNFEMEIVLKRDIVCKNCRTEYNLMIFKKR